MPVINHIVREHASSEASAPSRASLDTTSPGRGVSWVLLGLWLGGVFLYLLLSLAPMPFHFPHKTLLGPLTLDKIVHFAAFALFALAALRFFHSRRGVAAAMAILVITSVGSEYLQLANPTRVFSHGDWVANLLGTLFGLLAGMFLIAHWTGKGRGETLQANDA